MPSAPTRTDTLTTADGLQLQSRAWAADSAKGTVLVQHGFAEHGGRYGHLVDALVPAGYNVSTFDARGHGRSGGTRVFVERFDSYVDDLRLAIDDARLKFPGPLFLLGHSMGGLVAVRFLQLHGLYGLAGVILSNPGLANKVRIPAWKEALAQGASSLLPKLRVPSGIPPEDISRDPAEVRAYDADPLNVKVATARWYTEFVGAQATALGKPEALRDVPLLGLIGDGDRIVDAQTTLGFLQRVEGRSLTVKTYSGFYHELLNEPQADRARVLADIVAWLNAHLAPAAA